MKKIPHVLMLWALVLVCTPALTRAEAPTTKATKSPAKLTFLKPDSIDYLSLIPDPPAKGSLEETEELATVLKLQSNSAPADVERAKLEDKGTIFAIFSDTLGPWFTAENLPETKAFLDKVLVDAKYFSAAGKDHWLRDRPPFVEKKVKPNVALEKEGSYPSGHSTRATLSALILAELDPSDRTALIARGQLMGWDRVIGGVHYPSDVAAGRVLGQAEFFAMMKNPEFRDELEKVRVEFNRAHSGATAAAR